MSNTSVWWRVDCQAGCGLVSVFNVQLDHHDTKRLQERILATAGWLRVAEDWACPSCSHMLRERIGTLPTWREKQVFNAIQNALRLREMQVVP
jgi:hypothetical protein